MGAGLIPLSLIGSAIIGLVLYIMASRKTHESPYMLVLRLSDESGEQNAMKIVGENAAKTVVKAKTVSKSGIELSVEVRLKDPSTSFINRLCKIDGVTDATLVSYSGEYMS